MKKLSQALLLTFAISQAGFAAPANNAPAPAAPVAVATAENNKPSEASIRELLKVTHSKSLYQSAVAQLDDTMDRSMKEAFANQQLTPEKQKVVDGMREKVITLVNKEMNWESIEKLSIDIYAKAFTQDEINSMIAFYKSPGGQAILTKMPAVMQHTMEAMQSRMGNLLEKLQKLQDDTLDQLSKM